MNTDSFNYSPAQTEVLNKTVAELSSKQAKLAKELRETSDLLKDLKSKQESVRSQALEYAVEKAENGWEKFSPTKDMNRRNSYSSGREAWMREAEKDLNRMADIRFGQPHHYGTPQQRAANALQSYQQSHRNTYFTPASNFEEPYHYGLETSAQKSRRINREYELARGATMRGATPPRRRSLHSSYGWNDLKQGYNQGENSWQNQGYNQGMKTTPW